MTVYHIAGTTASGKSFIGSMFSRIYPDKKLYVVDLDNLFRTALKHINEPNAEQQVDKIYKFVQNNIEQIKKRHDNVLLVGYSDLIIDGQIKFFDLHADVKYFIDISIKQLISQYRSRASDHILHTRREVQTMSDDAIRKTASTDKKLYRGFRLLPQLMILKDIILRIGK